MAKAMQYNGGLKNCRFDIVQFNRKYLEMLFDEDGKYYSQFAKRLKVILPTHVAEICCNATNKTHKIFESSALKRPYDYSDRKIKKVNKWLNEHANEIKFGYKFFKRLVEETSKGVMLPDLPTHNFPLIKKVSIVQKCCHQILLLMKRPAMKQFHLGMYNGDLFFYIGQN